VTEPSNGSESSGSLTFAGFVFAGENDHVAIEIEDHSTGAYVPFTVGRVDVAQTTTSCDGTYEWNPWQVETRLPSARRSYESAGSENAVRFRARVPHHVSGVMNGDLPTFDLGRESCVSARPEGQCIAEPMKADRSGETAEIEVYVPCGATGQPCCAPWDGQRNEPIPYGVPCTGQNAEACDACRDTGAMCDLDFVCRTGLWPPDAKDSYVENQTIPGNELSLDWTDNLQGVATDGAFWYITQGSRSYSRGMLYKLSLGANLDMEFRAPMSMVASVGAMPEGEPYCWHWGDPEVHAGRVYVPMEECDDGRNRIVEIDANSMKPLAATLVEPQYMHAATVAIDPVMGEFYIPDLYDADDTTSQLRVYRVKPSGDDVPFTTTLDRMIGLTDTDGVTPFRIKTTQGMAISPTGKLYVAAQGSDSHVFCFQLSPDKGTLVHKVFVEMHEDRAQEYEGIAVFDIPGMGHIHLFTFQNLKPLDFHFKSGAWFKHISVADVETHPGWL
jgi:hypothetical protein